MGLKRFKWKNSQPLMEFRPGRHSAINPTLFKQLYDLKWPVDDLGSVSKFLTAGSARCLLRSHAKTCYFIFTEGWDSCFASMSTSGDPGCGTVSSPRRCRDPDQAQVHASSLLAGRLANAAECVRVCVCVRLCIYVCVYVCIHVCMYVCIYVRMYVCMYVCMYVSMYVCMYVCMHACMYVFEPRLAAHAPRLQIQDYHKDVRVYLNLKIQCVLLSADSAQIRKKVPVQTNYKLLYLQIKTEFLQTVCMYGCTCYES